MITLITGVPGTGKTCYMITFLLQAQKDERPIFVHGIPELKIPHTPVYCKAASCSVCTGNRPDDGTEILLAEEWDHWAPEGAVMCFDEVQNVYRPRKQGVAAPSSVMAFETHRHLGIDFYLLSQSPMLFDSNVRRLIGRHIHLRTNWAGRQQFEWAECQESVKSVSGAIKSNYLLEKKNFALYKSAELHTKQKKKLPPALYVLAVMLCVMGFLGYKISVSMNDKFSPDNATAVNAPAVAPVALVGGDLQEIVPDSYDYKPLVVNHPESAPAFSELVKVVSYPRTSACVHTVSNGDCRCYTQQGTRIEVEYSYCRNYVRERPFDPYKADLEAATSPRTQKRPVVASD